MTIHSRFVLNILLLRNYFVNVISNFKDEIVKFFIFMIKITNYLIYNLKYYKKN